MDEFTVGSKVADIAEFYERKTLNEARSGIKPVTVRLDLFEYGYLKSLAARYEISATKLATMLLEAGIRELTERYPGMVPYGFTVAGVDDDGQRILHPTMETIDAISSAEDERIEMMIEEQMESQF